MTDYPILSPGKKRVIVFAFVYVINYLSNNYDHTSYTIGNLTGDASLYTNLKNSCPRLCLPTFVSPSSRHSNVS